MSRDQMGANELILISDSSNPDYVPLVANGGVGLVRWPGGEQTDIYHWQSNSFSSCSNIGPSANPFDKWMQATPIPPASGRLR